MCTHCRRDISAYEYTDKQFHDGWLFPHGRVGYSDVTAEQIAEARSKCRFCPPWGTAYQNPLELSAYGPAGPLESSTEVPEVDPE